MKTTRSERDYAFGIAMMTLRTKIGLTQVGLAKHLGISRIAVGNWDGGSSYPKAEHLKELIALGVKSQAFPAGHEAEEIRSFWKSAHQKVLLDEYWLSTLLSQQSCKPSDTNLHSEERSASEPATQSVSGASLGKIETFVHSKDHVGFLSDSHIPHPKTDKTRKRRKWLLPSLIALVLVTIIASAGTLFFHPRNGATTQMNRIAADQAYPGYLTGSGTRAFFDPLSQEGKWRSGAGSECQFIGGAYRVSTRQDIVHFSWCFTDDIFSNFAIEVQLTIIQGDCGGITFRTDSNDNFYRFIICQYGTYSVTKYISDSSAITLRTGNSSAVRVGLGQQNKIAVVASDSTMTFYANERQIDQMEDSSFKSGKITLIASPSYSHATDVAYSNAKLWRL